MEDHSNSQYGLENGEKVAPIFLFVCKVLQSQLGA